MPKEFFKKIFYAILIFLPSFSHLYAQSPDFELSNYTTISYETGTDYVTVSNRYLREVDNEDYYFPPTGEKIFLIQDLPNISSEEKSIERKFKLSGISVKNSVGKDITYSVEQKGEGIYINVPNYKATTVSSPFDITLTYKTHDFITKVFDYIKITAPALPKDVQFSSKDTENNTTFGYSYFLSIIVNKDIPELARIFPSKYTIEKTDENITFSFPQEARIGIAPVVEFGTSLIYKFEYVYKTPKTDDFIDPSLSKYFKALSTDIYELSLPREYSETKQSVLIESISPLPSKIATDEEGNILGTFEVPANTNSQIKVTGYISVSRKPFDGNEIFENTNLDSYFNKIKKDTSMAKYLLPTTYWEVNDEYIQSEASKILKDKYTIKDLLEADYEYINEKLEYDQSKADSSNVRIGAKTALQGGASVCMEYSDAMITILRAQGIPARAAVGYAELNANSNSKSLLRHQWVQVWIPDYGWLTIDPTYEGPDKIIGPYIDKILWETFSGDNLSNIKVYSANIEKIIEDPEYTINIYAVENTPDIHLYEYSDFNKNNSIEEPTKGSAQSKINILLKTTVLGKAFIIVMPVAGILVILTLIIGIIKRIIKTKRSTHKEIEDQPLS